MALPHANDKTLCGAHNKSGGLCQNMPVTGSVRCRMHGGKSPRGVASPNFKHGSRSKYLPKNILSKYEELVADPELMNLRADVAIITSLLNDRLEKLDTGEAAKLWEKARKANDDIRKALNDEKYGAVVQSSLELDRIIGESITIHELLSEVQSLIDQRRRLVESEQKRLTTAQQMITSEQAMGFVAALIDSVRRHVTDNAALQEISLDISRLTMIGANKP